MVAVPARDTAVAKAVPTGRSRSSLAPGNLPRAAGSREAGLVARLRQTRAESAATTTLLPLADGAARVPLTAGETRNTALTTSGGAKKSPTADLAVGLAAQIMERMGFEPTTPWLQSRSSPQRVTTKCSIHALFWASES